MTLQKEADKQHARLRELCDKLLFKERVIAGIKLALAAIHSKLLYVKLKPVGSQNSKNLSPLKNVCMCLEWYLRAGTVADVDADCCAVCDGFTCSGVAFTARCVHEQGQLVTLVGEPKKDMEVISSKITRLLDEYGSETINEAEVDMKEVTLKGVWMTLPNNETWIVHWTAYRKSHAVYDYEELRDYSVKQQLVTRLF